MRFTFSLRTRLIVLYTVIFGVLLTTIAVSAYRLLARQLDDDATANLIELTNGLHGYLRIDDGEPTLVYDDTDPEEAAFVQRATRFYQVYDATTGKLLVQSDGLAPTGLLFTPDEVRSFRDHPQLWTSDTERIRLSNTIITDDAGRPFLLQVGFPLKVAVDDPLSRFLRLLVWGVPIGLVAAIVLARWMARVALVPLTRLATAARGIDVTNPRERLPVRGARDELDDVAVAFNETLARIENVMGEMRQFSTALAHELRSPIAALRGEIELLAMKADVDDATYRQSAASQLEELDKLKRMIDQLLTLARAESGQIPLAHQRVELGPLVTSVVEQVEAVAEAAGLSLTAEVVDQPAVNGDPEWLERMLLNLLDNAIKFTARGGQILVRLTADVDMAHLEVRDTGVGMPADVVPHVMERFYRADPARSPSHQGVGLGLSLVRWIVDRHHGSVDVDSQPGRGSSFTVNIKKI